MTSRNGVLTYAKDSDKPLNLTLTVPAAALIALAGGDMAAEQPAKPVLPPESVILFVVR